jgi:hypothetical protein
VVRDAWDRLLDFAIAAWLGLLDLLAPLPETPVDWAIREQGDSSDSSSLCTSCSDILAPLRGSDQNGHSCPASGCRNGI